MAIKLSHLSCQMYAEQYKSCPSVPDQFTQEYSASKEYFKDLIIKEKQPGNNKSPRHCKS